MYFSVSSHRGRINEPGVEDAGEREGNIERVRQWRCCAFSSKRPRAFRNEGCCRPPRRNLGSESLPNYGLYVWEIVPAFCAIICVLVGDHEVRACHAVHACAQGPALGVCATHSWPRIAPGAAVSFSPWPKEPRRTFPWFLFQIMVLFSARDCAQTAGNRRKPPPPHILPKIGGITRP